MRVFWVYGLLIAAGVAWNIHLPIASLVPTFGLGLVLWTPLEYVLHRYVFHRLAPHYQHHDSPAELQYIFAPLWFSGVTAVVLFVIDAVRSRTATRPIPAVDRRTAIVGGFATFGAYSFVRSKHGRM